MVKQYAPKQFISSYYELYNLVASLLLENVNSDSRKILLKTKLVLFSPFEICCYLITTYLQIFITILLQENLANKSYYLYLTS